MLALFIGSAFYILVGLTIAEFINKIFRRPSGDKRGYFCIGCIWAVLIHCYIVHIGNSYKYSILYASYIFTASFSLAYSSYIIQVLALKQKNNLNKFALRVGGICVGAGIAAFAIKYIDFFAYVIMRLLKRLPYMFIALIFCYLCFPLLSVLGYFFRHLYLIFEKHIMHK